MKTTSFLVACVAIMSVGVVASLAGAPDFTLSSPGLLIAHDIVAAMGVAIPASAFGRRGIIAVRADATGDPKALVTEIKSAFEQFKEANDARIKALETGKADALLDEKVETINAHITDLQSQLAEIATKAASRGLNGGEGDDTATAAVAFGREVGAEVSAEDFQAYRDGLNVYMRRGGAAPATVKAAMSVGSDPDGGYTVTPTISERIAKRVYETSPMRQMATVETIGTDKMDGFNDLDDGAAGWVGEKASRPETSTPQLGMWEIPVHEMYAMPKATQKLLDDSAWDIEGWLADKTAAKFARTENAAFVNGDGILKPKGLWSYSTNATSDASRAWGTFQHLNTGTSGGFGAAPAGGDKLIDTVFTLKAAYRGNANWMMARSSVAQVRKLKDGDGNYLWQPNFEARQGGLLLGYPIVEGEDVPVIAANSKSIAFGDFREAYTIVDRIGVRVLRDPYSQKGFVLFYTTRRTGGGAVNFEAVKFVRFGT